MAPDGRTGHQAPSDGNEEEKSGLPDWLKGLETDASAQTDEDVDWAADIDFSNLPGWLIPEVAAEPRETIAEALDEDEEEGTGLLAGVRGPIPVEPIITLAHEVPPFPGRRPSRTPANSPAATAPLFPERPEVHQSEAKTGVVRPLLRAFVVVSLFVLAILVLFTVALLVISLL
ncbi:MAG: hypothetical protein Q9O62_06500 [Ardenticatenia bacterium]|nr:hypothetical protein [Ardenticatenia bacterium]